MKDVNYTTIKVDTWETVRKIQLLMCKATNWIFRGQSDSEWELKTNLERQLEFYDYSLFSNSKLLYNKEKYLLDKLKNRAQFYKILLPEVNDWVGWLSLLQNYGGPTRLLDFTFSFYIAAFFSMEKANSDSAIWAINLELIDDAIEDIANTIEEKKFYDGEEYFDTFSFANYVLSNQVSDNFVTYTTPKILNERLSIQQGVFVFPCNINTTFNENLNSTIGIIDKPNSYFITLTDPFDYSIVNDWPLVKFIIPRDCHNSAMYDLQDMNITSETLFPGLDGFARSLLLSFRDSFDGEFDRTIKRDWLNIK